jgi:hypothetical protein
MQKGIKKMSELIRKQSFGVEIETYGISRADAAKIIAQHFGTTDTIKHNPYSYDRWECRDSKGRTWTAMSDCSIHDPSGISHVNGKVGCEIVTPLLQYEDIETLQEIIRELRAGGAKANSSCGIHVHVDASMQDAKSLRRLVKFFYSRQDLIYDALQIGDRKNRWCKPITDNFMATLRNDRNITLQSLESEWYSRDNDGNDCIDHSHYNNTRYHALNLHSYFTGKGIEYRLFNGTTHAGKIKAYIQFCLAMSAWAIEADESIRFNRKEGLTMKQKEDLWASILRSRLGLTGKEFATCRQWMMAGYRQTAGQVAA